MVSIIIVNYNGSEQTRDCLSSLFAVTTTVEYEVILVDNCSTDGSSEMIRRDFPSVTILSQVANLGFARANNIGARAARGEHLFFINNDTLFNEDIITPLKEFIDNHEIAGAIAPMLLNTDTTYQLSYAKYPSIINELCTKRNTSILRSIPDDRSPKYVDWVSFAAVMIRRSAFNKIGGFDERYFMYFEDADFCFRLQKAGFRSFYCAEHAIIHKGGGSWSNQTTNMIKKEYRKSQILFYALHRSWYENLFLRIYLIVQFSPMYIFLRGDKRCYARSVISMAFKFHANRP